MKGGRPKLRGEVMLMPCPLSSVAFPSVAEELPGARHWGHRDEKATEGHSQVVRSSKAV